MVMSRYNTWLGRPRGYRYGSWMTFYGCTAQVIGFSTSNWLHSGQANTMGLWSQCRDSKCEKLTEENIPGWLDATRAMTCVSIVLAVLWVLIGCPCDCLRSFQQRHRNLERMEETLSILAGCFGLLAVGVFTLRYSGDPMSTKYDLGWSLWVVVAGACCMFLGGCIVAITRNPAPLTPKPSTRSVRPGSVSVDNDLNSIGTGLPSSAWDVDLDSSGRPPPLDPLSSSSAALTPRLATGSESASYCTDHLPPPPYFISGCDVAVSGGNSFGIGLKFCPLPPPYENCIEDPPPPYEYRNMVLEVQQVHHNGIPGSESLTPYSRSPGDPVGDSR